MRVIEPAADWNSVVRVEDIRSGTVIENYG
jgi:hypothetical protein